MSIDELIRDGLRGGEPVALDLDRELGRVLATRARRQRRDRIGLVAVALVATLAVVTAGWVVVSPGGDPAPLRAVDVPSDQLVTPAPGARLAAVNLPRAAAASPDVETLVRDNSTFAFDLYRELATGNRGNLFLSPESISTTLAMVYAGAKANTATEIADALHFTLDPDRLHAAFNALDQTLLAPRSIDPKVGGEPLELAIDNSLWAQRDRDFIRAFLDTLAADYGAPVHLVDFAASPSATADTINAYVALQTKDRIPKLLSAGDIDRLTRLVLLNTVYFKGSWVTPFETGTPTPFHLLDGTTIDPTMMTADAPLAVAETDTYQAVRIPYVGGASMRVIVPAAGQFEELQSRLGPDFLDRLRSTETRRTVRLTMPKFSFATEARLDDALRALGVRDAFVTPTEAGGADFTGMSPTRDLSLATVVHQATVAVDERGTEASAATAAVVRTESLASGLVRLTVDRPFLVVIEDDATHAVLFAGQVTHPDGR
jgi:serpin B